MIGQTIIPMPIIMDSGGGGDPKLLLAIYIASNIFIIVGFIIYFSYLKFSGLNVIKTFIESVREAYTGFALVIAFVSLNGMALLFWLADTIFNQL